MSKQIVLTEKAPKPIGPYSQAVKSGSFVFCSGQIPLDPQTGAIVGAGDIQAQTKQALENLKAVLEASGSTLGQVIKTTLFLKNMADFPVVNEIYGTYFKEFPPARSTVEVSRLPKDVLFEIEAIGQCK